MNDVRNNFKALQAKCDLNGTVKYLSAILSENRVDDMLAGFCYWNISDSYAMMRKSNELYNNHSKFGKMIESMPGKYKFWCVCDATQRFTLELGTYGAFWWDLYKNAVENNAYLSETERIVFDAHVAAISVNSKIQTPVANLQYARTQFNDFIKRVVGTERESFYKLIYSSLSLKAFGDEEYDIMNLCNDVLPWLKEENNNSVYVTGEWERLNELRSKYNMAQVGINRAVNAFIDVGKKSLARDLYEDAKNNGFQTSSYIEKRL